MNSRISLIIDCSVCIQLSASKYCNRFALNNLRVRYVMKNFQSTDLSFSGEIYRLITIYLHPLADQRFGAQPFLNHNKTTILK